MRVLLADDHPAYLRGLLAILAEEPGVEVVATVGDGRAAVSEATRLRPDVVVMDLHLPELDGLEATRRLSAALPGTAVLVLTMYDDDASLREALVAGARGYLLKESAGPDIARAVAAVARGEAVFGSAVAGRVLGRLATGDGPTGGPPGLGELSAREVDVLREMTRGGTNRDIGRALFLSEKTVRNYVSSILAKLAVPDRRAAVERALDAGLGGRQQPPWQEPPRPTRTGHDDT
jgi:DNA-binding NarL/FixJ family response regulator